MNTRFLTLGGVAVALVILLAVNVLGNALFSHARVDLTEGRLYTLTDGTRNILSQLEEPVTLRLFLSQGAATRLPGINAYATRVRSLLQEYARAAGGMIDLRIIDPEPFSEDEDRAVGYGVQGIPIDDRDGILYFGLVGTSSTDDQQVIPFFSGDREEFLEYDLTRLIHQLAHPEPPVLGLMSTLPMDGPGPAMAMGGAMPQPWVVMEQIRQLFEVQNVPLVTDEIPAEIDVLMLVHPKGLSDSALYAIDQFVLGGGRAVVFVDPLAEADPAGGGFAMGAAQRSELDRLLESWGLTLSESTVVADLQTAARVQTVQDGRPVVIDYPVWMNIQPDQLDPEDVVTANLGPLTLATAGALAAEPEGDARVTPLMQSTPQAAEIGVIHLGMGADPEEVLRQYRPAGSVFDLAVRVTGPVESAFPDGAPAGNDDTDSETAAEESETERDRNETPHLSESVEDVNLIVVGDTDLLQDRFWVQVQNILGAPIAIPTASNADFVVNALDNLTGSGDLIAVRSRGSYARPFTLVQDIRQDAELRFRQAEQLLLDELAATEQKLVTLEQQKAGDEALILSEDQRLEIERFRGEKVRIRKELRDVRHELHKDIARLESTTKFVNIGLVPILVGFGGVLMFASRHRRRRRGRQTP